jgi:hypothetical protein
MLQELAFNPMTHYFNYHSFKPDLFQKNRIVTFVGIDTADMTIKAMHAATYPWKFLASLKEAFGEFSPKSAYSSVYARLISVFDRFPLPLLWQNFTPGGYFGEKRER